MAKNEFLDFDLLIEKSNQGYRARVLNSPSGRASHEFTLPFNNLEVENFMLRVGASRTGKRRIATQDVEVAKQIGGQLYAAVFDESVLECLRGSESEARQRDAGLRVRLRFDAPELAGLPWEFLYNQSVNRFLSLTAETPIVRYLDLPEPIRPLKLSLPLRVLAIISSPEDREPLNVEQEWQDLHSSMEALIRAGQVAIDRLEQPTLPALQDQLEKAEYHILHFVGHGDFDEQYQDGVLLFENEAKRGHVVSGQSLGFILHDHASLRLAFINACEGARTSVTDPFAGVAQSLVQQGIPAVIAMQFEISDQAAVTFAQQFYTALTAGLPVDAALSRARKAVFARVMNLEWGTPVLFSRAPDGKIFEISSKSTSTGTNMHLPSATLVIVEGKDKGRAYTLKGGGPLIIGRDENLPLPIQDTTISRHHAKISWISGGYFLEDLNSRNGTFANEVRVQIPFPLTSGDHIRVGDTIIEFQVVGQKSRRFPKTSTPTEYVSDQAPPEPKPAPQRPAVVSPVTPPAHPPAHPPADQVPAQRSSAPQADASQARPVFTPARAPSGADPSAAPRPSPVADAEMVRAKVTALLNEAAACIKKNKWDDAIANLEAALKLDPTNQRIAADLIYAQNQRQASILYSEAQQARARQDFETAIIKLRAILAIEPKHAPIKNELAELEKRQNVHHLTDEARKALHERNWTAAASRLQELLAVDPNNAWARAELTQAQLRGQQERSESLYAEAQAALAGQNWTLAVTRLQETLSVHPGHPRARIDLANAQQRLQQEKAANLHSEAQSALGRGDLNQAILKLQGVLQISPNHPTARAELADAQKRQRVLTLYAEAQTAQAQGNWRVVAARLQSLLAIDPDHEPAKADLALAQENLNLSSPPSWQEPQAGYSQPSYNQPGYQQPGYQQPGFQQPAQPAQGQQDSRVYTLPGFDPSAMAEELQTYFAANGYEHQLINQENSTVVQGKKGGLRTLIGMSQAATIIFETTDDGVKVSMGGGKWLEQGAVIAISMFVLWPLMLTGGAGIYNQKVLMDTLWQMIENRIISQGGSRKY